MGWIILVVIALATAALLWRLGVPRMLWTTTGAALMLGATGYALQGSPQLKGTTAKPQIDATEVSPDIVALRLAMFSNYTADAAYETAADAMIRIGAPGNAVKVILGGLDRYPNSIQLWTGLGSVLVTHDGGNLSPAALFAFQHAIVLNPRHPGPPFFLGLAYAESGRLLDARRWWARSLALTPAGASYRPQIADRLALLDQLIAMAAQQPPR
ncbi:MAG: hypothetical protein B7Y45_02535 [Sphingomonas sp. 28-66-16]|nr:MAG: hypothetical protein B7Y45_02535 [Sphingomonas sp. 28-66-16]